VPAGTLYASGDRILVQKFAYAFEEPKRWDVVVFKNPEDPKVSYIKRLVGLPGESLMILDGNIYTKPDHSPGFEGFTIQRKSDRPAVQRVLWQSIYNTAFVPIDAGMTGTFRDINPWRTPWNAKTGAEGWKIQAIDSGTGVPSRDIVRTDDNSGIITFDFDSVINTGPGLGPYNQLKDHQRGSLMRYGVARDRIEELRFAADVIAADDGLELTISTTGRVLPNPIAPPSKLAARFGRDGQVTLTQTDYQPRAFDGPDAQAEDRSILPGNPERQTELAVARFAGFKPGVRTKVELWYCDDEVTLWQNDKLILRHRFDIPINTALKRLPASRYPALEVEAAGAPVTLQNVAVDRDLYYCESRLAGNGVISKDEFGNFSGDPIKIENDQFYCLGDNSAFSHDSRSWRQSELDPWVYKRFLEKHDQQAGVVPRELLMGRAFFVYFPSPYTLIPGQKPSVLNPRIVPNFQDMRAIK
jgi:signal peptidase I